MVLRFFILAITFFFLSCGDIERDNSNDPGSDKYRGYQILFPPSGESSSSFNIHVSSSSVVSSSSSGVVLSFSSKASSSSVAVSSSSSVTVQTGVVYGPSVSYYGETYETVQIGTQTWFKRNLNYNASGSVCYNNEPTNCTTYGRLYNWATTMDLPSNCNSSTCGSQVQAKHKGICPSGWHIPSNDEWEVLMTAVSGSSTAGKKLKATSGWNSNGNGEDTYGFSALPGGDGGSNGGFSTVGYGGYWWSASEINSDYAYRRRMDYSNDNAYWYHDEKDYLFSVRCVKD